MKQQVVFHIGGGVSKANYKNIFLYLFYALSNFKKKSIKKWHHLYEENLGSDYQIVRHSGKNKHYASYEVWKSEFEKEILEIASPIILVGHSLGGSFILKYFSENELIIPIEKILLVAPAFKDSKGELLGDFNSDRTLKNFKKYSSITKIYHSKDDFIVPYSDSEDILKMIPDIEIEVFEDRGHFISEHFPEIIEDIKK